MSTTSTVIRTKPEIDERPCFVCEKTIIFGATRTVGESHAYAMTIHPTTGEWRWIHALCGLNKHTSTKRRIRWVTCATCGLPLRGDHMLVSGEMFRYEQLVAAAPNDAARAAIDVGVSYHVGGYAQCRDGGEFVRGRDIYTETRAKRTHPLDDADFHDSEATYDEEAEHPSDVEDDFSGYKPPF